MFTKAVDICARYIRKIKFRLLINNKTINLLEAHVHLGNKKIYFLTIQTVTFIVRYQLCRIIDYYMQRKCISDDMLRSIKRRRNTAIGK